MAKTKDCELIGEWIKSITNHLFWCSANAPDDNNLVKRWMSLMNHLCNIHEDCYHDPLPSLEERRKKWHSRTVGYMQGTQCYNVWVYAFNNPISGCWLQLYILMRIMEGSKLKLQIVQNGFRLLTRNLNKENLPLNQFQFPNFIVSYNYVIN